VAFAVRCESKSLFVPRCFWGTINAVFCRLIVVRHCLPVAVDFRQSARQTCFISRRSSVVIQCMIVIVIHCFVRHAWLWPVFSFLSVADCCGHISAFGQVSLAPLQWCWFDTDAAVAWDNRLLLVYLMPKKLKCTITISFSVEVIMHMRLRDDAFYSLCTIIPSNVLPLHMHCC